MTEKIQEIPESEFQEVTKREIKKLPKFRFSAVASKDQLMLEGVAEFCAKSLHLGDVGQVETRGEIFEEVVEIIANQISWIRENLGLDVTNRLPQIEKIRFLSEHDRQKFIIDYKKDPTWQGVCTYSFKEILVSKQENDWPSTISLLNHELVHNFSYAALKITVDPSVTPRQIEINQSTSGFSNAKNNSLEQFNEAITDTLSLEMLASYEAKFPNRPYLDNINISYYAEVFFLDLLIKKLATNTDSSVDEVKKKIYRGYCEGDFTVLKIFDQALGKDTLKKLAKMKFDYSDWKSMVSFVSQFDIDIDEWRKMMGAYQRGEFVTLATGISVKRSDHL